MNMPSRLGLAAAVVLACAPASFAEETPPAAATVTIKSFAFMQMSVTIAAGGSVTWKNVDEEPHSVVSIDGLFRSGGLDQGDSFSFKFIKPGVYRYICSIHPQMQAQIVVQ